MTATALDTLTPIGLTELVARAELQTRLDRKYVLPQAELRDLYAQLPADARVLHIGGRRNLAYRSVYYDTPELTSYRAAAQPRRRRFKVRVRSYLDTDTHLLEVKTRGARGTTVKTRQARTDRAAGESAPLGAADLATVAVVLDEAGIRGADLRLQPVLTTTYQRSTLFLPGSEARVTVDTDLSWTTPAGDRLDRPGLAIVETKSARAANDVDRLLWRLRHRPTTVSKYGTGLAALHPQLPANKWRPVLRRYFDQEN